MRYVKKSERRLSGGDMPDKTIKKRIEKRITFAMHFTNSYCMI